MCFGEKFIWRFKKKLTGIVNKTGYSVYLMERLPPKYPKLQLEVKHSGIKTVTNNCELQVACPGTEVGVSFRAIHMKAKSPKLKDVAVPLRNISTIDNRRSGERNNSGSTGLLREKKLRIRKNLQESTKSMRKTCL